MKAASAALDPRLPPGPAVRALALALIDDILARLPRGDARAVHDARRTCKQLRALLRLARPRLGAQYAAGNAGLRDANRALAADRDAQVLVDTARALLAHDAPARRELVRAMRRRVPGARQADLRDARRAYRACQRRPAASTLHEWRKQVKYHRNQLALVAPLWPQGRARVRALDTLGDLLGWHHDLHMLELAVAGLPRSARRLAATARHRIAHEQLRATREALKLGKILFAGAPPAWLESLS